uniref:Uncharacterized protein n=1 Tax=Anguilla anguilla TaxID=7936 RepID=A0A0E9XV12_ANGAN
MQKKKKRRKRWYVRPLNQSRTENGEFCLYIRQMRV